MPNSHVKDKKVSCTNAMSSASWFIRWLFDVSTKLFRKTFLSRASAWRFLVLALVSVVFDKGSNTKVIYFNNGYETFGKVDESRIGHFPFTTRSTGEHPCQSETPTKASVQLYIEVEPKCGGSSRNNFFLKKTRTTITKNTLHKSNLKGLHPRILKNPN